MNTNKSAFIVPYFVLVSAFFGAVTPAMADDADMGKTAPNSSSTSAGMTAAGGPTTNAKRGISMVYDPDSKKYFIGGSAKFELKQGEGSSIIDRIDVSVDGKDYTPYTGALAFTVEGKHTIKFRAINPVNNYSPVQFTEVFVDLTPPTTEARFNDGRSYKGEKMTYAALMSTISLVAQDNLSGVQVIEYAWETPATFLTYTHPIMIDKPGHHILYYRSADRVGNEEPLRTLEFVADGSAPLSEMKVAGGTLKPIVVNTANYLSASDSVAFALDAKDEDSGVNKIMVGIDGKPATPYLKPLYFLTEGPHNLTYWAEDNVGNKEEAKSIALYTVSVAPRTTATAIGKMVNTGGINFARPDLRLQLTASDNVVGLERIEWRTDKENDFHSYVEPIRFDKAGLNTVVFRSVDRTGNVEPSRSFSVNITDVGPETAVETAQPLVVREGVTYSPSPNVMTLNVKNSGVGVQETQVSVNDAAFNTYTGPMTLTTEQKVYKITYKSIDKLGNEELPKTVTFHMIGSMPVVDLFISNDRNKEEQVRTNYFEGAGNSGERNVASQPTKAPKAPKAKAMKAAPQESMDSTPAKAVSPATKPSKGPAGPN